MIPPEQQARLIDSVRRRCQEKEQLWLDAHQRTQALDKVIDRHQHREQREAQRTEQKLNDEFASRRRRG